MGSRTGRRCVGRGTRLLGSVPLPAVVVLLGLSLLSLLAEAQAAPPEETLVEHGCLACHSVDGTALAGPTFVGLFERQTRLTTPAGEVLIAVDDAYVRRSIVQPSADVVVGYRGDTMPAYALTGGELDALVEALRWLEPHRPRSTSLSPLVLSLFAFVFFHLGLSFHPVRRRLVARLGEKAFQAAYSVLVLVAFCGILYGWTLRPFIAIWTPPAWTRWVPNLVMPIAFVFLTLGFTTKSPTFTGQEGARVQRPSGVVSITRHPGLWGFALWGFAHLAPNGDLASVLLFSSISLFVLVGMLHIDRRRSRLAPEAWGRFGAQTSIVPRLQPS